MTKRVLILVSLLTLVLLLGVNGLSTAVSPGGADNVVIVSCLVDTAGTPAAFRAIKVAGASSSAHAPEVPTGARTNCAQTLAALLSAGFELMNVEGSASGALYTLYRKN